MYFPPAASREIPLNEMGMLHKAGLTVRRHPKRRKTLQMTDHTKPPNEQLDPKPIQQDVEHVDLPSGALDEVEKSKTDDDATAA
jgi:hypothetical protein